MYLGIDPGIRKLGYALIKKDATVVDAGILLLDKKAPSRNDQFDRMEKIYDFFVKLVNKNDIKAVGIEKLYFTNANQSNAEFVYGVRGALSMLFHKEQIEIFEWTPNQLKKRITGNGKASKSLMQTTIKKLFQLAELPKPHDAADALGLCWMVKHKMDQ